MAATGAAVKTQEAPMQYMLLTLPATISKAGMNMSPA